MMPLDGRNDLLHEDFPVSRMRCLTREDEENEMDQTVRDVSVLPFCFLLLCSPSWVQLREQWLCHTDTIVKAHK